MKSSAILTLNYLESSDFSIKIRNIVMLGL